MRPGFVYVVQSLDEDYPWIKIGWAKDVARRMVDVASEVGWDLTLLGTIRGTQADETALMRKFSDLRIAYDWFAPRWELVEYARNLPPIVQVSFVGTVDRTRQRCIFGRLETSTGAFRGPYVHLVPPRTILPPRTRAA